MVFLPGNKKHHHARGGGGDHFTKGGEVGWDPMGGNPWEPTGIPWEGTHGRGNPWEPKGSHERGSRTPSGIFFPDSASALRVLVGFKGSNVLPGCWRVAGEVDRRHLLL